MSTPRPPGRPLACAQGVAPNPARYGMCPDGRPGYGQLWAGCEVCPARSDNLWVAPRRLRIPRSCGVQLPRPFRVPGRSAQLSCPAFLCRVPQRPPADLVVADRRAPRWPRQAEAPGIARDSRAECGSAARPSTRKTPVCRSDAGTSTQLNLPRRPGSASDGKPGLGPGGGVGNARHRQPRGAAIGAGAGLLRGLRNGGRRPGRGGFGRRSDLGHTVRVALRRVHVRAGMTGAHPGASGPTSQYGDDFVVDRVGAQRAPRGPVHQDR